MKEKKKITTLNKTKENISPRYHEFLSFASTHKIRRMDVWGVEWSGVEV